MKKILYLLFVVTITNIQGIMAQEKITQTAGADGKAAFQREMIFPIGEPNTALPQQLAHSSCDQRRRTDAGLRSRKGLVSGMGKACRADASGRCRSYPGECEALAWSGGGQLVCASRL